MLSMGFSACFKPRRMLARMLGASALAFLAIAAEIAVTLAANAQQPMGWLELKPVPGRNAVQIVCHAIAFEAVSGVEFTLAVKRENRGNKSSTRQTGRIDLAAGESKMLSTTSINVESGDSISVEFKMLDHGAELFSTIMSATPSGTGRTL